jgi:hypothetical protein
MSHKSHVLHALEGLDRYPNYLSRISLEDTETLEQALQERLNLVRVQQQAMTKRRQGLDRLVANLVEQDPRWKALFIATSNHVGPSQIYHFGLGPSQIYHFVGSSGVHGNLSFPNVSETKRLLVDSISTRFSGTGTSKVELDARYLQELMDEEEMFDVYSFPLLFSEFCETVQSYVRAAMAVLEMDEDFTDDSRGITKDLDLLGSFVVA